MPKQSLKLGSLVAVCALLAACGSQPSDAPAPSAEPAAQPAAAPTPVSQNFADYVGNAEAGKAVYNQCRACHSLKADENRVGPSLHAIVGLPAGHLTNFRYSEANKNSGLVWNEETLFNYLRDPKAMVPGTTMAFYGIGDPQKRADLVAFLKTNPEG